jgi:hypothetical protein
MTKMPTFYNNMFVGWLTPIERSDLRYKAKTAAKDVFKTSKADHVVYEYIQYRGDDEHGTAHYYNGLPFDHTEFEKKVASIPHAYIGAFHSGTCSQKL